MSFPLRFSIAGAIILMAACSDHISAPAPVRTGSAARLSVDPAPTADGLWLGVHPLTREPLANPLTPDVCYKDRNPNINDTDEDWLDQDCEYLLAQAFSPWLMLDEDEHCFTSEPVFAAKYFPTQQIVRIAYMFAYHMDCGVFMGIGSHNGDSEMVVAEISFNDATEHWVLEGMYMSAHDGACCGFNHSAWHPWPNLQYQMFGNQGDTLYNRSRGFPRVYVSEDKHANYRTKNNCEDAPEDCGEGVQGRWMIYANRNAGSPAVDLLGCIPSTFGNTGRLECFFTMPSDGRFRGWYLGGEGATPYRTHLLSERFEYKNGSNGFPPPPPPPPSYYVSINGPDEVPSGAFCYWYAATNVPNPVYEWRVNGSVVGTSSDLWWTASSSFTLEVNITGDGGAGGGASKSVSVTSVLDCPVQ